MLTACTQAAAGPGAGLLAALGAWTWLGGDPADTDLAYLLLAHPPGRTEHDAAAAVETRMLQLSAALGGPAAPQDLIPDVGRRLLVADTAAVLRFDGTRYSMRLPVRPGWTDHVRGHGQSIVLIGLDPLPRSADRARVDVQPQSGDVGSGPHCVRGERERLIND